MDVVMQGMDGYEVVNHIKALYPNNPVPIIMISASLAMNLDGALLRGLEAGAIDLLYKPFNWYTFISPFCRPMRRGFAAKACRDAYCANSVRTRYAGWSFSRAFAPTLSCAGRSTSSTTRAQR